MKYLRSAAFTLIFPVWTGICCIVLAFGPLLPRKGALRLAFFWVDTVAWIERNVLGLNYRVIGEENRPRRGSFIVAAKHQSTYETMKLHPILGDPAIVLKKELLRIPIWGRYLRKTGMIPIDRGAGRRAIDSMLTASLAAKSEGRPIVIFPQGTRVPAGQKRSYKSGVVALYSELDLPIVPLALNSGIFWPKKGLKHGGTVTFSFLPPIEPGLEPEAALAVLEQRLEAETNRLVAAELQDRSHS
ncbi:MAG TPA: lysophospholipid acyltransferase family protein [Alphaproteobacteria bacterium]|jgi:1-acyl-sn-glycerol-3-phosphate acyltransferase|nr:lysophospholipid acyltransferase family protein [Alphaproteobacteria bacterium]